MVALSLLAPFQGDSATFPPLVMVKEVLLLLVWEMARGGARHFFTVNGTKYARDVFEETTADMPMPIRVHDQRPESRKT